MPSAELYALFASSVLICWYLRFLIIFAHPHLYWLIWEIAWRNWWTISFDLNVLRASFSLIHKLTSFSICFCSVVSLRDWTDIDPVNDFQHAIYTVSICFRDRWPGRVMNWIEICETLRLSWSHLKELAVSAGDGKTDNLNSSHLTRFVLHQFGDSH